MLEQREIINILNQQINYISKTNSKMPISTLVKHFIKLLIKGTNMYLKISEREKHIEEIQRNCRFLIVDEISMVRCRLSKIIHMHCKTTKCAFQNMSFGGMFVYLFN